jgi:hypothetical protein
MLIIDWLNDFIAAHEARHPRDDWPGHGLPESRWRWSTWFDAFKADRITKAEAEAASCEIDGATLARWQDHLWAIRQQVKAIRARASVVKADRPEPMQNHNPPCKLVPLPREEAVAAAEFLRTFYPSRRRTAP